MGKKETQKRNIGMATKKKTTRKTGKKTTTKKLSRLRVGAALSGRGGTCLAVRTTNYNRSKGGEKPMDEIRGRGKSRPPAYGGCKGTGHRVL